MAEEAPKKANKKINKLTAAEIENRLKEVKEKMGGVHSKYAAQLIARKEELSKPS